MKRFLPSMAALLAGALALPLGAAGCQRGATTTEAVSQHVDDCDEDDCDDPCQKCTDEATLCLHDVGDKSGKCLDEKAAIHQKCLDGAENEDDRKFCDEDYQEQL